ncbi:MAG: M24 family metallopeptidase [Bryobacterales bacterium]|nr:M24 family metallopeptidase [Bryobacterales bacterium]
MGFWRRVFLGLICYAAAWADSRPFGTQREWAGTQQEWLKLRLERALPGLMRAHGVDMWVVVCREYNEDPAFWSLVSPTVMAARRVTILIFYDRGATRGGVERLALGGGSNGGLYEVYRDPSAAGKELYLDAQWRTFRKAVDDRRPRSIALNISTTHAFSDGLTAGLRAQVEEALGPEWRAKIKPAELLPLQYIQVRLPEMLPVYRRMMAWVHETIAEMFSNRVITPGKTTDEDLVWHLRQKVADAGLTTWFQPTVKIQRAAEKAAIDYLATTDRPVVIQRGDVLHTDFGIVAMRLATDTQHMAYVLKEGETDAPAGLRAALANGNRLQDIVMKALRPGRTGNQALEESLAEMRRLGINGTVYSHPIGDQGHGAGPLIGLWDRQEAIPGRGDVPVLPNTWYSVELSAVTPVPEWNGQNVAMNLEEDCYVDADGKTHWVRERQSKLHLIR